MASYDDTATVSGSVVSIENGADEVGAKSCVVTVRPTLSGVSSVSEKQIPSRNMASMSDADFTLNSVRYKTENGILYINGTSTGETSSNDNAFKALDFWLPSGTYFFNRGNLLDLNVATYLRKYDDKSQIKANTGSFTLTENTHLYISFYVYNKVFSNLKAMIYINIGSTAITYEDTAPVTTYSADLGRTVYGAEVDFVSGTGKDTGAIYTITSENVNELTRLDGHRWYIHNRYIHCITPSTDDADSVVCDKLKSQTGNSYDNRCFINANGAIRINTTSEYATNSDFLEDFGGSITFAFILDPSYYTDFTFDGQEIPTRKGYNAFWSEQGDTELTYYKDGYGFTSVTVNKLQSKNFFPFDKNQSFLRSKQFKFRIPKGSYTISWDLISTTAETLPANMQVAYYCEDGTTVYNPVTTVLGKMSRSFTLAKNVTAVTIYSSTSYATSAGVTATIDNIQLELGSQATSYEPYVAPISKKAKFHRIVYGGQADVVKGTCKPKNLFDVGTQRSDYNRSQVTNVSDGVVSFEIYSSGNTFAYRNYDIKTFGMITFSAVASKKSSRFIIRIRNKANTAWLSNNDTSIDGWNYNAVFGGWYKESSSTTEPTQTATIPNTDASFWQLGLGYANTYTTVGETETISDIMVEEGSTASSYVPHFEPFSFPPISISTDQGENTLFANEGASAITYRKAVD